MRNKQIREYLRQEIAELIFAEPQEVEDNMSLTEELGVDSLEMQELYLNVSKKYEISLNLVRIINDVAVIIDKNQDEDPDTLLEKIEQIMMVKFTEENRADFKMRMEKGSRGRQLEKIQSYVTLQMLADAVEVLVGEKQQ